MVYIPLKLAIYKIRNINNYDFNALHMIKLFLKRSVLLSAM